MKPLENQSLRIAAIVVAMVVFAFGYRWGGRSAQDGPLGVRFQVTGMSMAPTFVEGQVCHSTSLATHPEIGDVVAIDWDGKRRLKRVAALGGDLVEVVDGRLMVNGRRLEDIIADRNPADLVPPALVLVNSDSDDWASTEEASGWILYGHRNVHQSGRITPVTDDYPVNDSVRRKLNDADRLAVEIRKFDSQSPAKMVLPIRVAFFDSRYRLVAQTTRNGMACSRDAGRPAEIDAGWSSALARELDASHPIALQISKRDSQYYSLRVLREIEYRDDRPSGNVSYPLRVPNQEVFVVGDNVPVSVDSRQFGPLPLSALIGRVHSRPSIGSDR
jgi:signal peptidase I